jgi:ribonuclease HII
MWVVGIDEAGYGPNLGPLVQAAVAVELPDGDPAGWDSLKPLVRKARGRDDGRILVDDSKKVYTRGGIEALERGLARTIGVPAGSFHSFLQSILLAECLEDLCAEHWFACDDLLPLHVHERPAAGLPFPACTAAVNLVPTKLFNQVVSGSGSKGTVLACGLTALLGAMRATGAGPLVVMCDKQGGRNFYAAMLQASFPDGWVVVERESAAESRYRIENIERPITVSFRPRADGDSIAVALASMLCKYLREVCMGQFNRFWAKQVPGLEPTAGYPNDARRFYERIEPLLEKLGLTAEQVWRSR